MQEDESIPSLNYEAKKNLKGRKGKENLLWALESDDLEWSFFFCTGREEIEVERM